MIRNMIKPAQDLILDLERYMRDQPSTPCGICSLTNTYALWVYLRSIFHDWPEFTGNTAYPVPHPTLNPDKAYECATNAEMWSENHTYGQARLRLAAHVVNCLKLEIAEYDAHNKEGELV
jgi:hypothetical protein